MGAPVIISVDTSELLLRFDRLDAAIAALTTTVINQGTTIMATIQDVQKDLDTIKASTGTYIAGRDAADAALNATITSLTAQLAAGTANAATVQAGIDAAFAAAEAEVAALAPPVVTPPAITPLPSAFPDKPTFTTAATAYKGPEAVTLDGTAVPTAGPTPAVGALAYFTHSDQAGLINETGPTS
jgi:hypothetical protein